MTFKVGNAVAWESHGGRKMVAKVGVVVAVVPAGKDIPEKYTDAKIGPTYGVDTRGTAYLRDQKSYVVAVKQKTGKDKYYWPAVSKLSAA